MSLGPFLSRRPEGARRARNEARRVPTSRGTAGEPDKERDGKPDGPRIGGNYKINISPNIRISNIIEIV